MPSILCIGDSLTQGREADPVGYRTYRGTLQTLLTTAGVSSLDFVGPNFDRPASGGTDGEHAGWGGACIDGNGGNNITDRLAAIKAAVPAPDLIVFYIGWNDIYTQPTNIASRYATLLASIQSGVWAGRKVVCCTVHPEPGKTEAQTGATYAAYSNLNTQIRALCTAAPTTRILADLAALSGADPTAFVTRMLARAQAAPDTTTVQGGGTVPSPQGGHLVTSFRSIQDYNANWNRNPAFPNDPPGGAQAKDMNAEAVVNGTNVFVANVCAVVPWAWMWPLPGHASTNTCIELRNGFAMARHSVQGWRPFFQGARFGQLNDASVSSPNGTTAYGTPRAGWRDDGVTSWYCPDGNRGIEVWPTDTSPSRGIINFYGAFDRDLVANAQCFVWGAQARLALIDPNGPDDRARARFMIAVGGDFTTTDAGYTRRYDRYGWPLNVADGGHDAWEILTSTEWVPIGSVTIGKGGAGSTAANSHYEDPGTQPPLAGWSPATPYNDIPTYALSADQVRASPPPVPTFWEGGGGTGNGWVLADYWTNPATGNRDIHWLQPNADRAATVILRAIITSGALGTGGGAIFSPLPGLPVRPNVFAKLNGSTQKNIEPKEWATPSAPTWRPVILTPGVIGTTLTGTVSATGSPAPTYSKVTGPSWLTINSSTGALGGTVAGPAGDVTVVLRATNASGSADVTATLSVVDQFTIVTTSPLPNAIIGANYGEPILVVGGVPPYTHAVSAGSLLPGFVLSGNTIVGNAPSAASTAFTVAVTDSGGSTASRSFTLAAVSGAGAPVITTGSLADAVAGVSGTRTITATGDAPITWSVSYASVAGHSIGSSTGVLSYPALSQGSVSIAVVATNAKGTTTRTFVMQVFAADASPAPRRFWIGPGGGGAAWRRSGR